MRGFSLVELSIVLVILGLLTGGILAGQSLIRASELRAVTAEFQRYSAAANTFRSKYFAIPGDFNGAIKFWGDDVAACTDGNAANNGTPGTCNGDGDGIVEFPGAASTASERAGFWQHLANAGMIEGTYGILSGTGGGQHTTIGTNAPRSKLTNAGWTSGNYLAAGTPDAANFSIDYNNHFMFGAQTGSSSTTNAALKPEEAWNIDTKLDDGMPGRGKVYAVLWAICTNAADSFDVSTSYRLNSTNTACGLRIGGSF